jgi:4-hydroxy-3-methylbut-2-en-1-yl diphosphate reductase
MAQAPVPQQRKILLANPRGYCAGVDRAIDAVQKLLEVHGAPLYVRKEIVHNRIVVEQLARQGVIFVDEVDQVPERSVVVFSAHGIAPQVRDMAARRRLHMVDATCPLVTKVHVEAIRFVKEGLHVIFVGHGAHDEAIGTMGEISGNVSLVESTGDAERVVVPDPDRVAVVTQTTLSVDDTREIIAVLRRRFPSLRTPPRDDICYATQNRQDAVKALAQVSDVVIVVGSESSSNSQRLRECATQAGTPAYLIDDPAMLQSAWIRDAKIVGVTAGASTPESSVRAVVDRICADGPRAIEDFGQPEPAMRFVLPEGLEVTA